MQQLNHRQYDVYVNQLNKPIQIKLIPIRTEHNGV